MIFIFSLLFTINAVFGAVEHKTYFTDKKYKLDVFIVQGVQKGPTIMVMGGIHGDEPSGAKAVELYKKVKINKGTIILVPDANRPALLKNKRYINGDMNRLFGRSKIRAYETLVVKKLKELIKDADAFVNLHEGSGFFRDDPKKYGQSIVIDKDEADLKLVANGVVKYLNDRIKDQKYHFSLNSQQTMSKDTKYPEQRDSATYYALNSVGIPAFAVDVSKDIKDEKTKIAMHCTAIRIFAEKYGIKFEKTGDNILPECNIKQ